VASFEGQIEQLQRAGRERIFFAQVSAVAVDRPELDDCMEFGAKGIV
jgi:hypothetical protein